jgi:hypothetical protein
MMWMKYIKNILHKIGKKFIDMDKISVNVTQYFVTCKWMNEKWMNFLDEKIIKDVICWTSLDNTSR